jgi:hypothetical protein
MNRRKALTLLGLSAALGLAGGWGARRAMACGPEAEFTKPIKFEPGRNSVEIKRSIKGDRTHEWIVTGKPGQVVQISIDAKKSKFTVTPDTKTEKQPVWGSALKSGSDVKSFAGKLPASGRMLIEVWTSGGGDSYVLGVTLV